MFSIEAIPCLTALPLQARLGLLFSFSAYLRFLSTASLRVETHWFPLTLGWPLPPDSLTTGSHTSNRAGLGLGWCCSLPRPLTGQKPPHRAEFGFSPQNEFTPPPKGGGAGYCFSLVVRVLLGSCLWQLLATTGSHASNRACLGLQWCHFLTWLSKSHTGPHRAEFRFHRFFFLDFLGGSPASWRSRW